MSKWYVEDTVVFEVEAENEEEAIAKFLEDENPIVVEIKERFVYEAED